MCAYANILVVVFARPAVITIPRWFGCLVSLLISACSPAPPPAPLSVAAPLPQVRSDEPPEWRPGDAWTYQSKAGLETQTRVLEVIEIREMGGVRYYVVRTEGSEHYYTMDLQWAGAARDRRVEARITPPLPWFAWPLDVGRRWSHKGIYEDPSGKREFDTEFAVTASEMIEVPAGRFQSLKVVRESAGQYSDEYWYVPEVRFYARWVGRRGNVDFDWKLEHYRAASRLIPGPRPSAPSSR